MKKIIGLLVAAIICVGIVFTLNVGNTTEESKTPTEQLNNESIDENVDESITQAENKETILQDTNDDKIKDSEKKDNIVSNTEKNNTEKSNSNTNTTNSNTSSNTNTNTNSNSNEDNNNNKNENNNNDSNNSNNNNNDNSTVVKPEPEKKETVTIAINMKKAIDYGILKEDGFKHLSPNGVILSTKTVQIKNGDTVYDVLAKVVRENKIQMEYTGSGSSIYIQGIDNLYEFDCGKYSGWMYEVNGVYPNYGVGAYSLKAGDKITFNYTCDLGKDLK